MYERMLDKQVKPSFDDLINYSGESGVLWLELDKYLLDNYSAQKLIRFPYGNKYGWGVKYSYKNKHICDIFAENNAFTVFMRFNNTDFATIENILSDHAKNIWDKKYPCGEGGWIRYRVLSHLQVDDIIKIINAKLKSKSKTAA